MGSPSELPGRRGSGVPPLQGAGGQGQARQQGQREVPNTWVARSGRNGSCWDSASGRGVGGTVGPRGDWAFPSLLWERGWLGSGQWAWSWEGEHWSWAQASGHWAVSLRGAVPGH